MIFFIIFSSVLLIIYSYVGWRLLWPLEIQSIYKIIFLCVLALFYLLPIINFVFYFNKIENSFTRIIAWLGYTGLGAVSLLFFIQICVDLLAVINKILFNICILKSPILPNQAILIHLCIFLLLKNYV